MNMTTTPAERGLPLSEAIAQALVTHVPRITDSKVKTITRYIERLAARPLPSDWVAAVIAQVDKVEGAIDDASRQYHDSTRWPEEPSVYDDRSSPSLQDVIDQGFNDLRDMLKAAPSAPAEGGASLRIEDLPTNAPLQHDERKDAEQAYTLTVFDYERAPIGSHDWSLYWRGWWHRVMVCTAPEPLAQGEAVDWTDKERAAIREMMDTQGLSYLALVRQAVRMYQHDLLRRRAGETCTWSGDAQRAREFAGDIASPQPAADEEVRGLKRVYFCEKHGHMYAAGCADCEADIAMLSEEPSPPQPSASAGGTDDISLPGCEDCATHKELRRLIVQKDGIIKQLVSEDDERFAIESALTTAAGGASK